MDCFNFKSKSKPEPNKSESCKNPSTPSKSNLQKTNVSLEISNSKQSQNKERGQKLRVIEFDELRKATEDFNEVLKVGEGGFGFVYKGFLISQNCERLEIAVRGLKLIGFGGNRQWLEEVLFFEEVEHPNLVKLVGYCVIDEEEREYERFLVYEFIPNKSLDDHLFNPTYPNLSWDLRLRIILGAAEGLAFLHEGLDVQIIFLGFKASNILLDKDFKPKLSDFGLARRAMSTFEPSPTVLKKVVAYYPPEYIKIGHITTKTDVWSFGLVLYELITGRQAVESNRPKSEQNLFIWAKQFQHDGPDFRSIMDPRLGKEYPLKGAREVARLAEGCLVKDPKQRPKMCEVVESLKMIMS